MFIYKINIQNANCVYLLAMEIKKAPFIIAKNDRKKKRKSVHLTEHVQSLYAENHKFLMKSKKI